MTLYETWLASAYYRNGRTNERTWADYIPREQAIYEDIIGNKLTSLSGTVTELAERYNVPKAYIAGFVDGINDTQINLVIDLEKLYKQMVEYKADHLYSLPQWEDVFTREQLDEIICGEELANYFEMSQALSELADNGNVIIKENELIITDKGKKNSETLEHDIPFTVREQAFNAAVRLQTRLRRERENKIRIDRVEKGCNVTISVVDADDEIMSVKLFVADYDQALAVKERFLEDPVRIYSNIVALLLA